MANFNAEIITKVEEIIYTELINEKMEIRWIEFFLFFLFCFCLP
jgi:hypothetical protein